MPSTQVFKLDELRQQGDVDVGRTDSHVVVKAGPWRVWLPINKETRFPHAEDVIPRSSEPTHLRLSSEDVAFLIQALPSLPAAEEDNEPITLDLGDTATVRARVHGQQGVEVRLANSVVEGKPVRICTSRRLLIRGLTLGLNEFVIVSPDAPVQARDNTKVYVWMPLPKGAALAPSDKDVCISSAASDAAVPSCPVIGPTTEGAAAMTGGPATLILSERGTADPLGPASSLQPASTAA